MVALGQAKWSGLLGPLAVFKARVGWEMTILQSGCPISQPRPGVTCSEPGFKPKAPGQALSASLSVVLRQVSLGQPSWTKKPDGSPQAVSPVASWASSEGGDTF